MPWIIFLFWIRLIRWIPLRRLGHMSLVPLEPGSKAALDSGIPAHHPMFWGLWERIPGVGVLHWASLRVGTMKRPSLGLAGKPVQGMVVLKGPCFARLCLNMSESHAFFFCRAFAWRSEKKNSCGLRPGAGGKAPHGRLQRRSDPPRDAEGSVHQRLNWKSSGVWKFEALLSASATMATLSACICLGGKKNKLLGGAFSRRLGLG